MTLKNIKITPINLMVAVCITYAMYCLLGLEQTTSGISNNIKVIYILILALVLFLTDIIFRRFVESNKWIWLIQGSFILLIIVMMIIFQKI